MDLASHPFRRRNIFPEIYLPPRIGPILMRSQNPSPPGGVLMFRGLLFCSILAAQFIAVSAIRRDDASLRQNLNSGSGNGPLAAIHRADDPFPCPECELSDPG